MYQALYRKYRPQTFDDVVGQQAVTQTLKTQLQSGKLSHAYLFTGSRGTGKTSSAKILAKAVNCLEPVDGNPCNRCAACMAIDSGSCMDVLEIDAASNNGVDNVRDLRDDAIYTPSQVKKRVYIIDEVHMLSLSAFNALLKIIEEPPEHLLFILATTELHKVPATILSRCQRFSFRRISQEDIAARLQYVAYQENIDLDDSAARVLARLADGGMRDGLSLLDQCASAITGEVNAEKVYACLGVAGVQECAALMDAIARQDAKTAMTLLDQSYCQGKDMGALLDELACLVRDLMILQTAPAEGISMLSGVAADDQAKALAKQFAPGQLSYMMNTIQRTLSGFSRSASRRMDTELCILNLCKPELMLDAERINARLSKVEEQLKQGVVVATAAAEKPQLPEEKQPEAAKEEELPANLREEIAPSVDETPAGFWIELVTEVRKQMRPPLSGFFAPTAGAPVQGRVQGDRLILMCESGFVYDMINKPELMQMIGQKASAMLGRKIIVSAADQAAPRPNPNLDQLLDFGKSHADVIHIK